MSSGVVKALAAMGCITALEIVNLIVKGPDSALLGAAIAAIAGLGGYLVGKTTS